MAEPAVPPTADLRTVEDEHASGGVTRRPVTIVRARGATLIDDEQREYIDCAAGHGWANVGHSHPKVVQAIQDQAALVVACTESAYNDQRALWFRNLAQRLAQHIGASHRGHLSRIHPCNSGTEAIEAALKFARYQTGRQNFVAFQRGFHGRTLGALSATAQQAVRRRFEPLVPGFAHAPFNDVGALDAAVTDETAGVILEIIQGEGGVHEATPEFLEKAQHVCRERGALLIIDEIQTGFGRTGRWFACEHHGTQPDVIALGKSLGGGIPMGAVVWRSELGTFASGSHGSTFGGGPLACAASRAVMGAIDRERLVQRAESMGTALIERLRRHDAPVVRAVRGRGFMIGVELRVRVTPILRQLMERGVWALPAGSTVLRLLPPLVVSETELDTAASTIEDVLRGC